MLFHFGYLAKMFKAETIFLCRDFEEGIYMDCPQGMSDIKKDNFIILDSCIYGLIQAAQQYYKKVNKILKNSFFLVETVSICASM